MARKTVVTEVRVVVEPRRLGDLGYVKTSDRMIESNPVRRVERYRKRCKNIVEDIRRHVDDVGHVFVEEETDDVCGFCGRTWTEGDSPHNGGCCEEDAEVYHEHEEASGAK